MRVTSSGPLCASGTRTTSSTARSEVTTESAPTTTGTRSSQRSDASVPPAPAIQRTPRTGSRASSQSPDSAPTAMNTIPGMLTRMRKTAGRSRARTRWVRWAAAASSPYANATASQGRSSPGTQADRRACTASAPGSAMIRMTNAKIPYRRPRTAQA